MAQKKGFAKTLVDLWRAIDEVQFKDHGRFPAMTADRLEARNAENTFPAGRDITIFDIDEDTGWAKASYIVGTFLIRIEHFEFLFKTRG